MGVKNKGLRTPENNGTDEHDEICICNETIRCFFFRCVDRISFLLQRQTTNKEHVNRKSALKRFGRSASKKLLERAPVL